MGTPPAVRPAGRAVSLFALPGLVLVLLLSLLAGPVAALDGTEDDFGARALRGEGWSTPVPSQEDLTRSAPVYPMTPPVSAVTSLDPPYYADGCHAPRSRTTVVEGCLYGDVDSDFRVAVLGDSKVGAYFEALEEIALREGWALRMYTKSACAFADERDPTYPACDAYHLAVRADLEANPPDLVITGGMRRGIADSYVRTWMWLRGLGVQDVVALWDAPVPDGNPADCVAQALEVGTDLTGCALLLPEEMSGNPSLRAAAERVHGAQFIDLRDWVCPVSVLSPSCAAVLGRAQLYGSGSHLAPTFTATLTEPIYQRLYEAGVTAYRPSVDRVGGDNRFETAALLSRDALPGGRVFLASGEDFPDALAAAAKAGATGATVLLTRQSELPAATVEALERLAPQEIIVVGGDRAVDDDLLIELRAMAPQVRRVDGANRYATAAAVAEVSPVTRRGTVYVATGDGFPDALAAAARAGQEDAPILLVRHDSVPAATANALRMLSPRHIVVAGGSTVVEDDVLTDLSAWASDSVERRGGDDRYATAALLAQGVEARGVLHLSSGSSFADALAAAPVAAQQGGAVLLVAPDRVPAQTERAITALDPARLVVTGGVAAVTKDVERAALRLVR